MTLRLQFLTGCRLEGILSSLSHGPLLSQQETESPCKMAVTILHNLQMWGKSCCILLATTESENWSLPTAVLEKTPESPLDSKEIKPVNLKGNQPWTLAGRTDAEAEAPVFWSSDMSSRLIGKVSDAGKDWGQKEKGASEEEMVVWHHWCNGHELG